MVHSFACGVLTVALCARLLLSKEDGPFMATR